MEKYITSINFWAIVIFVIFGVALYIDQQNVSETKYHPQPTFCASKTSGSRPACWTQDDWNAFCDHTGICKNK